MLPIFDTKEEKLIEKASREELDKGLGLKIKIQDIKESFNKNILDRIKNK